MREVKKIKLTDKHYPPLLKEIHNPPEQIYYRGSLIPSRGSTSAQIEVQPRFVAIVGTRKATRYGLETAKTLARELSHAGVVVVSGLALGIDSKAHLGALEGPTPTWAVLGSGVNHILPRTNERLAQKIIEQGGAVISEYEPDRPAEKWTFPERNRIIAGLSRATIVVEAPERSGALITAFLALDYNRDVGAVPGEIISINSKGTNNLLRLGAAVIRSADDVLELIGIEAEQLTEQLTLDKINELEQAILQCLEEPKSADEISQELRIPAQELSQKLTVLELCGKIKNKGGLFNKI